MEKIALTVFIAVTAFVVVHAAVNLIKSRLNKHN
jgi:hypothetical protein